MSVSRLPSNLAPPVLPHLAHVARYWDAQRQRVTARLLPGEYYVTDSGELITTVLGSCVSVCVRDAKIGVGGMNHFMLPESSVDMSGWADPANAATRYGAAAMERLVNDVLSIGGQRDRLEFKFVGGGRVIDGMETTRIGDRNIEFIRRYAKVEGLRVAAEDLGGIYPRKLFYCPVDGKLSVKLLRTAARESVFARECNYQRDVGQGPQNGSVELF